MDMVKFEVVMKNDIAIQGVFLLLTGDVLVWLTLMQTG